MMVPEVGFHYWRRTAATARRAENNRERRDNEVAGLHSLSFAVESADFVRSQIVSAASRYASKHFWSSRWRPWKASWKMPLRRARAAEEKYATLQKKHQQAKAGKSAAEAQVRLLETQLKAAEDAVVAEKELGEQKVQMLEAKLEKATADLATEKKNREVLDGIVKDGGRERP